MFRNNTNRSKFMYEEFKSRLNSGIACCHSVQSLLFSHLLCRNVKVKIYKTIILPFVLYGSETCSLTLGEEHSLRAFENRVLRRIFGHKRDEATGEWRKLHSGELHNSYSSPNIIRQIKSRRMSCVGHVASMGEERKVYKIWVGRHEGKRLFERPRYRWEDGIRMDLRKICREGVEWIHLTQDRDLWWAVVNMVKNLQVLMQQS
jgi:hypothetical protein